MTEGPQRPDTEEKLRLLRRFKRNVARKKIADLKEYRGLTKLEKAYEDRLKRIIE